MNSNPEVKDKILSNEEILTEFEQAKAILRGHFILSSGLHSDTYLQCARALMNPTRSKKLCSNLSKKITARLGNDFADIIVAPAMGGVVIGYEMGCQLNLDTIFCERVDKEFLLRRGFELKENMRVLVVEDVITTGKSSLETYEIIKKYGAKIVAEACLIDRSNQAIESVLGVPVISLAKIAVKNFDHENIPDELKNILAIKPGSRFLNKNS
jgi:orotate phosphoribosyltransferase